MSAANNVETFRWNVLNQDSHGDSIAPSRTDVATTPTDDAQRYKGYRVASTRLPGWDYTANAYYFVTICTHERQPFLGEIANGQMILTDAGRIVDEEWQRTADVRPDAVLDEYVVMPNHVHAIIVLNRAESLLRATSEKTSQRDVSTPRLIAGSLGAIVNQFKGICTKRVRDAGVTDFGWQPRFYDHIIRDEQSLDRIRQYVADNPLKWELEHETPENLWM